MNPFAARREKKQELQEYKIEQFKEKFQAQGGSQGDLSGLPSAEVDPSAFKVPESSVDYEAENFDKYLPKSAQNDQSPVTWSGGAAQQYEPPSRAWQCAYKLQNGFVIGASLGSAIGFLYGTYAAISYRHILYLPIAVLQSGGAFGLFLACGTVIRCEEPDGLNGLQRASLRAAGDCGHADSLLSRHLPDQAPCGTSVAHRVLHPMPEGAHAMGQSRASSSVVAAVLGRE